MYMTHWTASWTLQRGPKKIVHALLLLAGAWCCRCCWHLLTQAVPFMTADIVDRAGLGCMHFEAIMQEGQNSRTKMHPMASKTIAIMVVVLISPRSAAALPSAHHVQRGPIGPDAPKGYVSRFVTTVIRRVPIKSCSWRTCVHGAPYHAEHAETQQLVHCKCNAFCVHCMHVSDVSALARQHPRAHRITH
jgi:hypothetical protein